MTADRLKSSDPEGLTIQLDRVASPYSPVYQELVRQRLAKASVSISVIPRDLPFMRALAGVVPSVKLDIRLVKPISFKPDNGLPTVDDSNVREIGLILTDSGKGVGGVSGREGFQAGFTLWIGTRPGYVSCGLAGGANFIVEEMSVEKRRGGGILKIKAFEEVETPDKIVRRRDLEVNISRAGGKPEFSHKLSQPRIVSR